MAAEKGRFWEAADQLYALPQPVTADTYREWMTRFGLPAEECEQRLNNPDDPAVAAAVRDEEFADGLGINQTPVFILFVNGQRPVSSSFGSLSRYLNSPTVQSALTSPAP